MKTRMFICFLCQSKIKHEISNAADKNNSGLLGMCYESEGPPKSVMLRRCRRTK